MADSSGAELTSMTSHPSFPMFEDQSHTEGVRTQPGRAHFILFPLHYKQFRPWEVCSLDVPWSCAASHSLMHFKNRRTWKASQYYIIIIVMASFMRVSYTLVFHRSKCISAIKCMHSTTATYISSSFFKYLCIPC